MKKSFLVSLVLCLMFGLVLVGTVNAKSVYLVANHHTAAFDALAINPDGTVTPQTTTNLSYATDPAGVAVWADPDSDDVFLFLTSEFSLAGVEIVNAITNTTVGRALASTSNLAGIDVDDANLVVYTLRRASNQLFVYDWDPATQTLTSQASSPYSLPGCSGGYGISLDDNSGILWVADGYGGMARAYDVTTMTEITGMSFDPGVHNPIDLVVDSKRGIVHTVSMNFGAGGPGGSYLMSSTEIATGTTKTTSLSCQGVGISVDETTGYVYVTVSPYCSGGGQGQVQVWDTSTTPSTQIDVQTVSGSPAGIAVANASVNPLRLAKNDIIQGAGVSVGSNFTYHITCDNTSNPNLVVNNVTIFDTLPIEVDFVSTTNDMNIGHVYDSVAHTITWDIGIIDAGAVGPAIDLVVQVNANAVSGMTIQNYVTINGDEIPETTVGDDENCDAPDCEPGTEIIDLCGDLDDDGDVDGTDRNILRGAFRTSTGDPGFIPEADYDEDGDIDYSDYREWYICYKAFING